MKLECSGEVGRTVDVYEKNSGRTDLDSQPRYDAGRLTELTANIAAMDGLVTFVLNVILGSKPTKIERHIAREMFSPSANVVLVPRGRPTLACALSVEEFFVQEKEMLRYCDNWREVMRSHDPFADGNRQTRIKAHVVLDSELPGADARHADLTFTLRGTPSLQRIASCTIVYDELYEGRSPATLY